ncbi:hypothetical protein [Mesorhizobium sp. B1-1-9]|uniref:hypothetical protein n=1 Tax=Mesorhizobium sp. B1-1-9 TaxID=2589975 RepID=UPI001FED9F83|nr:hypothetical protein [Mesorhizobium sp. B1-1-9]
MPGGRHFGAQALQFGVEILPVGKQLGQFAVLGVEFGLLRLQMREGFVKRLVTERQHRRVESQTVGRLCLAGIGARQPETDVEQFLDRAHGVARPDGLFLVHGAIAQRVDELRLREHRLARRAAKAWFMQKGGDIVLIGQLQARVVAERPFDRKLDRLAGEERCCGRRLPPLPFGFHSRLIDSRKLGGEEGEVGHQIKSLSPDESFANSFGSGTVQYSQHYASTSLYQ